jgi:Flp pilus assembly protein TadD
MSGKYEQAVTAIEKTLSLTKDDPQPKFLMLAGQIYEAAGETNKAITVYHQLLKLEADNKSATEALERLSGK